MPRERGKRCSEKKHCPRFRAFSSGLDPRSTGYWCTRFATRATRPTTFATRARPDPATRLCAAFDATTRPAGPRAGNFELNGSECSTGQTRRRNSVHSLSPSRWSGPRSILVDSFLTKGDDNQTSGHPCLPIPTIYYVYTVDAVTNPRASSGNYCAEQLRV